MAAGLTEKQRRFCDEYIIDLNATRAYMAAYPSVKKEETASVCASQLLRNPKVQRFLQELKQERKERVQIKQDDVLCGIKEIAFESAGIRPRDRLRALELLGKHLGLFDPHKDELDREEQRARIEKLRQDARNPESGSQDGLIIEFIDTYGSEI